MLGGHPNLKNVPILFLFSAIISYFIPIFSVPYFLFSYFLSSPCHLTACDSEQISLLRIAWNHATTVRVEADGATGSVSNVNVVSR